MRIWVLGWIALAQMLLGSSVAVAADRPNIVFIVVEDLSPRIGSFGDPLARTPNIDRLASEGVRFTRTFTTAGVCAPSRAALITGMYQQSFGGQHMRASLFELVKDGGLAYEAVPPAHIKAFPEYLRANGYTTINNFKTDYQFGDPTSIWDFSSQTAGLADREDDRPFFLMLSDNTTHESGLFVKGKVPHPGTTGSKGVKDHIIERAEINFTRHAAMKVRTDHAAIKVPPFLPDTPLVRFELAQHYDNISLMDDNVGKVMADLEEAGLLENTIVIWTTDHGDGITRAKRMLYDSGLHVPMIIRFPDGRNAGEVRDDLVSFVDLAPTILSFAGVSTPEHMHGQIFLGENAAAPRQYIYGARDRFDEFPDRSRGVRDERYKLIRNYDLGRPLLQPMYYRENLLSMQELRRVMAAGELSPVVAAYFQTPRPTMELFDTVADPFEMNNLADDPAFAEVQARLTAELDSFLARYPDTSDIPERDMVRQIMWPGGIQPVTTVPTGALSQNTVGERVMTLASATPGASIEYRLVNRTAASNGPWRLYTGPVTVPAQMRLEGRAIRYGFKPSGDVVLTP